MAGLAIDDYNGEIFQLGGEGEIETEDASQICWVSVARPANWVAGTVMPGVAHAARGASEIWLNECFTLNVENLVAIVDPVTGARLIGDAIVQVIAYIRMILIRQGWVNEANKDAGLMYNLCRVAGAAPVAIVAPTITVPVRGVLRGKIMDLVCMCAYFFRIRGHHYQDDFEARLTAVWRKAQHAEDNIGVPWIYVMRHALHAIQPLKLDEIWLTAARDTTCAGTLQKRISSRPAGAANVAALRRGVDDLMAVMPKIGERLEEAIANLEAHELLLDAHRWNGSVNHRFYGTARIPMDEGRFGAMASIIYGALQAFCPTAPLARSIALHRMADNAPITGSLMVTAIASAAKNPAKMLGF